MKKKLVMREWVEYLLLGIFGICIIVAMSECEDEFIFIVSHLFAMLIMILIYISFLLYWRKKDV